MKHLDLYKDYISWVFSMKGLAIISSMLIFISCGDSKPPMSKGDVKNIKYHSLGDDVFGINMKHIAREKVVKMITEKGHAYTAYEQNPSMKYPEYFESKYFIGTGMDSRKIFKVCYSFPAQDHVGSGIIIYCNSDIYSNILRILTEKYGEPNVGINENTGKPFLSWEANPEMKSAIEGIAISTPEKDEFVISIVNRALSDEVYGH